jgi:phosphotransferase system IIB component
MNNLTIGLLLIIIALVVLVILAIIIPLVIILSKKKLKKNSDLVDVDDYILALGGKSNIVESSYNLSRLQVQLNDPNLIDPNRLKGLGASGVVKSGNKVSIIIGKASEDISKFINDRVK